MLPAMVEQERREKLRRVSTEKLIHRVSDRVDASHHGPVLMPDEGPSKTSTLLAAGAISGGVSKLLTAPIDRIKIIYQVNTDPRHAFTLRRGFSTASSIVLQSGVLALWRGNSAAVARDVPYASIVFASYAMYEDAVLKASGVTSGAASGGSVWSRLVAGSAAGATATFLTYPLDVMRARLAADSRSHHHGCASARLTTVQPRGADRTRTVEGRTRGRSTAPPHAGAATDLRRPHTPARQLLALTTALNVALPPPRPRHRRLPCRHRRSPPRPRLCPRPHHRPPPSPHRRHPPPTPPPGT